MVGVRKSILSCIKSCQAAGATFVVEYENADTNGLDKWAVDKASPTARLLFYSWFIKLVLLAKDDLEVRCNEVFSQAP